MRTDPRLWLVFCLVAMSLLCVSSQHASAFPQNVLVDLFQAHPPIDSLTFYGPAAVRGAGGERVLPPGRYVVAVKRGGILVRPVTGSGTESGACLLTGPAVSVRSTQGLLKLEYAPGIARKFRGCVIFGETATGRLRIQNRVSARDYVVSVVGSETNPDFPQEELKAQAVLAQTLLSRYKTGDDLGDTTEKEAYLGAEYERPGVRRAVDSVWREILTYHGRPATVYFHSACAGGTSSGEQYFHLQTGGYPYLSARDCSYCKRSPFSGTKSALIPADVFRQKFPGGVPRIVEQDARSRPLTVRVAAANGGTRIVSGFEYWSQIGRKLGWDKVPGTRYDVRQAANGDVTFTSTGAGHGVGLCQWGAAELAREGKSYKQILEYYFPGTTVQLPVGKSFRGTR